MMMMMMMYATWYQYQGTRLLLEYLVSHWISKK